MVRLMYERVAWPKLYPRLQTTMGQGEHAVVIAPTGRGKTVLMQQILPLRSHSVFFGTKTYDDEYLHLQHHLGYKRAHKWPAHPAWSKVLLWPDGGATMEETRHIQRDVFQTAINKIFRAGRWSLCFDELHWMTDKLGLYDDIAHLHHQGRSSKLTCYDGFQRPAFVPVIVYSSATHIFVWGTNYKADLDKLSSVAKLDALPKRDLAVLMGGLGKHEFVYVNVTDNRPPIISKVAR